MFCIQFIMNIPPSGRLSILSKLQKFLPHINPTLSISSRSGVYNKLLRGSLVQTYHNNIKKKLFFIQYKFVSIRQPFLIFSSYQWIAFVQFGCQKWQTYTAMFKFCSRDKLYLLRWRILYYCSSGWSWIYKRIEKEYTIASNILHWSKWKIVPIQLEDCKERESIQSIRLQHSYSNCKIVKRESTHWSVRLSEL